jgi:hypothetical protein
VPLGRAEAVVRFVAARGQPASFQKASRFEEVTAIVVCVCTSTANLKTPARQASGIRRAALPCPLRSRTNDVRRRS